MPDTVIAFLAGIGLGLLEDTFAEHDIDGVTLFELDENDLKEMGIRMGPRRKLLAALRDAAASRPPPATSRAAAPPDDGLAGLGVRALKALAAERGVDISRCCEKSEIVALLRAAPPPPAPAPVPEPAAPLTTAPPPPPPPPPVASTPAAPRSTMGAVFGAALAANPNRANARGQWARAMTAARDATCEQKWMTCLQNAAKANNGKQLSRGQKKQLRELWEEKKAKEAVRRAPPPPRREPPAPEPALLTHLADLGLERFAPALARAGVATAADLLRVAGDAKRLRDLTDSESGARVLPVGPYSKLKASLEKLRDEPPRPVSPPQEASKRAPAPPPPAEAPKPKKKEKRPAAPTTPADSEASVLRSRVAAHENTIKQLREANEKLRAAEAKAAKQTIKQLNAAAASKATLRDQLEAARSALDALSTENATLRDQNAALREDVWRPGARVEASEAEAARLRDRLGLRLQEAAKLKAENEELHREVSKLRAGVLCSLQGADTAGRKLFQERVGEIFAELTAGGTAPNEAAAAALRRATAERAAQTVTPGGGTRLAQAAPHRMIYDDETDSELEGYA